VRETEAYAGAPVGSAVRPSMRPSGLFPGRLGTARVPAPRSGGPPSIRRFAFCTLPFVLCFPFCFSPWTLCLCLVPCPLRKQKRLLSPRSGPRLT
jgi:hypothetical protein